MKLRTRLFIALATIGVIMTVMGVRDWMCLAKPVKDITDLWDYDYSDIKTGDHVCFDVTLVWDQIGTHVEQSKTYGVTTSEKETARYYLIPFCQDSDKDFIYPTPFLLAKIPSRFNAALDTQISKSDDWWASDEDFSAVPVSTMHFDGKIVKIPKDIRRQIEENVYPGEDLEDYMLPVMFEPIMAPGAVRGLSIAGISCLIVTAVILVMILKGKSNAQTADYGMSRSQGTGYVPQTTNTVGASANFTGQQPQNMGGNFGTPLAGSQPQDMSGSFGAAFTGQQPQNMGGNFGTPLAGSQPLNTISGLSQAAAREPLGPSGTMISGNKPQQDLLSEAATVSGTASAEPEETAMSEEEKAAAEKARQEEEARAEMLRAMAYASSHPAVLPLGGGGEAIQQSAQAVTLPLGVSPAQVSSGPSDIPVAETAGTSSSGGAASQPVSLPVNDGAPAQQNNNPLDGSAPAQQNNNSLYGSTPAQQNNNPLYGSAPAQQNNNPLYGSAPAQQNNNPLYGSAPAQQNNNPLYGNTPAQQSNTPLYGSTPAQQSNTPLYGSTPAQQNNNPLYGSAPAQQSNTPLYGNASAQPAVSAENENAPLYADNTEMKKVFSGAFADNNNT
ncbi:MAG: hypothetical protein IJ600_02610 [Lachnospiraceae bacterium]|nr:hypothetical protein [Lachnospiraceae bacterium]